MLEVKKKGKLRKYSEKESDSFNLENLEGGTLHDFANGRLISIELENWMNIKGPTKYDFNNGINIITGLNGSGKSSIVCGIAISLGYDTHILSRGHYLSSYIRNGSTWCKLIITIRNNIDYENNYVSVIERVISIFNKNDNKSNSHSEIRSNWKLNGRKCIEKDVLFLRNKLNINLDNMMNFLAQQRVSYFSTQTPQEIFVETLKIMSHNSGELIHDNSCNSNESIENYEQKDLFRIYNEFIDISRNSKDFRLKILDRETKLTQLENEISKSKQNELKYIEYLHHKMGINLVNFFQLLNEIKVYKDNLIELNDSKKEIIENQKILKEEFQVHLDEKNRINNEFELLNFEKDQLIKKIMNKLSINFKNSIDNINNVMNKLQDKIKDPEITIENYNNKIKNLEIKIENTKNNIFKYKNILKEEWIDKLKECKLYIEEDTKLFDIRVAENKRKLIGNDISNLYSNLSFLQRKKNEYEFLISKLNDKKEMSKKKNLINIAEKMKRESYLNNISTSALSSNRKENIIKFFKFMEEYNGKPDFKNRIPNKKVLGPIGSYLSIKNLQIQSLVEVFLQQFHYYFVAEREDVRLLTERYNLNVLTLSNLRNPIYPKIDQELKNIGISGFLHEYLIIEDETIKNILYQISSQFFTCAIVNNYNLFKDRNEDELLYKLSDWFKKKYDKPGNKISNNVYLFINTNDGKLEDSKNNGILYKLMTSIYNPNSKTISMTRLSRKMNTILINTSESNDGIVKKEFIYKKIESRDSIDDEIDSLKLKLEKTQKEHMEIKEQYDEKRKLLNLISECIDNIPSIQNKLKDLEENLQVLKKELESDIPVENEINLNNKKLIKEAIFGNSSSSNHRIFQSSIEVELKYLSNLFLEISTKDFSKNMELSNKISDFNMKLNQIQNEIKKKKDQSKIIEIKNNEINTKINKIMESLENTKKDAIEFYLQFYSTFCHYNKRSTNSKLKSSNISSKKIYEYIYHKNTDQNIAIYNSNNDLENTWKNVPGVDYFTSIMSFNSQNNNNVDISLPSYCIDILYQISVEFGLISKVNVNFKEILDSTIHNNYIVFSETETEKNHQNEIQNQNDSRMHNEKNKIKQENNSRRMKKSSKKDLTLFNILLDNEEYKKKYNELYDLILRLESKTHNTNLERVSELEQEHELLKIENQHFKEKIEEYQFFISKNYKNWIEKLKFIENYMTHSFSIFMKFINNKHDGKIIIPFIDNYLSFESNNSKENLNSIFDFFVNNFEKDSKLNIMVRFSPDEDLRLFSSNSISGGEQSLCTILYILSLQGICKNNAFKLFDEINQGLDNSRELKLMELLDILTDKEKTKNLLYTDTNYKNKLKFNYKNNQIIIITPHIFPGIIFKNFSVHFVLNGPGFIVEEVN